MGQVIEVDFRAVRNSKPSAPQSNQGHVQQGSLAQWSMLKSCAQRMTLDQQQLLYAATHDYDTYLAAPEHIQLLVDIYQMLEAF